MLRYECDVCHKPIESSWDATNITVTRHKSHQGTNEFHVCLECWDKVKPAELQSSEYIPARSEVGELPRRGPE